MAIDIDTTGMSGSEVAIQATFAVHTALLSALVVTHPDPDAVKKRFRSLMSELIERVTDPQLSGAMTTLEGAFRALV